MLCLVCGEQASVRDRAKKLHDRTRPGLSDLQVDEEGTPGQRGRAGIGAEVGEACRRRTPRSCLPRCRYAWGGF